MSKEKLKSLSKYSEELKNKKSASTPEKHKGHPESYLRYLDRELEQVNKKIASLKVT